MVWYPKILCLAFAMGHGRQPLAFNAIDQSVVQLVILDEEDIRIWPVNSSLETYAESVTRSIEGAPYDEPDLEPDNIKAMINAIDPGLADEGTFWNGIAWDAGNGDWITEILESEDIY